MTVVSPESLRASADALRDLVRSSGLYALYDAQAPLLAHASAGVGQVLESVCDWYRACWVGVDNQTEAVADMLMDAAGLYEVNEQGLTDECSPEAWKWQV